MPSSLKSEEYNKHFALRVNYAHCVIYAHYVNSLHSALHTHSNAISSTCIYYADIIIYIVILL